MDFLEVVKQARAAFQSEGRITYRVLKRQFALDDEALEDLHWFTEGFDTKDLQEAKALLEELS